MEPIASATVYEIDHLLMRLAGAHGGMLPALSCAAADVMQASSWTSFGYRNCEDFARERLNRNGRWLRRLATLQRAMQKTVALQRAVAGTDGGPVLRRAAAYEIATVVTSENAAKWIARARRTSVRELRNAVRAARNDRKDSNRHAQDQEKSELGSGQVEQPLVSMRLVAPPEAHVCHDEVMDLHGALVGHDLGTKQFVENLLAEAASGGTVPRDADLSPSHAVRMGRSERKRRVAGPSLSQERIKRRRALLEQRSRQPVRTAQTTAVRQARRTLLKLEQILARQLASRQAQESAGEAASGPRHPAGVQVRTLSALIRLEDEIEIRMGQLLADMAGYAPWKALGFSGQAEYASERLGWSSTETYRRVRLARRLRHLPAVQAAYENGRLGVEAATWLVRSFARAPVSTETQHSWIEHASTTTVKRLRHEDRMLQRGQLLARGAVARETTRTYARRAASARALARVREPAREPAPPSGRRCPAPPSDVEWKTFTARKPGQARDLVLGLGSQLVERVAVRGALAALPLCFVLPVDLAESFWGCLETERQRLRALQDSPSAAAEARLSPSERIARGLNARGEDIPHWVAYLSLLEEFVCTWDDPSGMRCGPNDSVHSRDGWMCGGPGCTQRRNLQGHHLKHRAHGGSNEAWNLHSACAFHHLQGEHGALAHCRGRAPLDVVWRLGVPELAAWFRNETRIAPPHHD